MASKQRYKPAKSPFAGITAARWADVFPDFIEPCHPTQHPKPPPGDKWVHEIKVDGYRCQLHLWHGAVTAYTGRGNNWASRCATIVEAAKALPVKEAIIDGEIIVTTPEGLSDFGALQQELAAKRSDHLTFYAFDLLYVDGYDLRGLTTARSQGRVATRPNRRERTFPVCTAPSRRRPYHSRARLRDGNRGYCFEAGKFALPLGTE